ncbi:MAG: DSD1 family PLP-dependent enzyme [Candidatus Competibacterales bacterium]
MPQRLPARPGDALADVETPALVVDVDVLEDNLARMTTALGAADPTGCVQLRPHAKTHKCPTLAQRQLRHGAVGVCCQKLDEAEAMVRGGIDDVLITNQVVGPAKTARLAALAREARLGVCVDSAVNVEALGAAARRAGATLDILVEIDVGGGRCGVAPGEAAVALAQAVERAPGLNLRGLQAYHGPAQHLRTLPERSEAIHRATALTHHTRTLFQGHGLCCEVIGGAGTGTFPLEAATGVYTEVQPGSYVFMDADYARNRNAEGGPFDTFGHSLWVLTTVISVTGSQRAVVDAGHKAVAMDSGMPLVWGEGAVPYTRPSDEHGVLDTRHSQRPFAIGEQLRLVPGHCDPTVNLYDYLVAVGGETVVAVWPITGRGAVG